MYGFLKGAGVAIAFSVAAMAGTTASATPMTLTGDYDVSSVTTGSHQHALWLSGIAGSDYWQFDADGGVFTWDGRRARLRGSLAQNGNANNVLDLDVIFSYRGTGLDGQGTHAPKTNGGGDPLDWDYFDLDSASLMGMVGGSAVSYDLTIRPNDTLPAQLGVGANDKDGGLGFSSWVFWDDGTGNRIGDINIRLSDEPNSGGPSPVPLPASGLLLLAGLGAAGVAARRRKS